MKRILSMLLAVVMVISMFPVVASAAEVASGLASADSDTKWTRSYTAMADGTLTITVGDGNAAWASDVYDWNTWAASAAVTGTEEASYTYDVVAGAEYTVRIYGQGEPTAAIADIPYSIVFTPASGEEDTTVTVNGNVLNDNNGVAMKGTDVEIPLLGSGNATYAGQQEHFFTPAADGILTVHIINSSTGWWYSGENLCGQVNGNGEWAQTYEVRAGVPYSITLGCYEDWSQVTGTISYEILFYEQELEVQKEEYIISESVITATGVHSIAMEALADMTIVTVTPNETGVYTLSVPAGTAVLNSVGSGSYFIEAWDDAEAAESVEWTCKEIAGQVIDVTSEGVEVLSQGQSLMLGIKSENASVEVTLTKTGEYVAEEIETINYENKAELTPFEIPEGAVLGAYVNVEDETVHTAVLGADGYYHLDSEDGDILLIDMDYQDIVLSDALNSERPVMKAFVTLDDGTEVCYIIGDAVLEYESVADSEGYYYLTEDLILFYENYATANGTWLYHGIDSQTNPDAWLYCCRTLTMPQEDPEGSLTNPIVYATVADMVADWTGREVAGGETVYFQAPLGGETVTISSDPYGAVALVNTRANLAFAGESFTFEVSEETGITEGQVLTVGIWNQNPGAPETVTLTVEVEADGSVANPFVYESFEALIADWQNRTVAAGATVYVKAPLGGETLIVSSDTTAAALVNSMGAYVAYHGEACVFDAFEAGATVTIGICNQNPRGSAVVTLSAPASGANVPGSGTVADPYCYETVEALIADWQERVIAAGTTVFVNAPLGGETLTVTSNSTAACLATPMDANLAFHNEPYTFSEVDGFTAGQFITIGIKNQDPYGTTIATLSADSVSGGEGETEITYTELPMGSTQINDQNYYFTYTAAEPGVLSLSTGAAMGTVTFSYSVNGDDPVALGLNSVANIEMYTGDIIKIDVIAQGYSSLSALWTAGGDAGEEDPNALVIGDNEVSVPAGLEGGSWTFTATEAGTLSASVSALTLYEPSYEVEGEFVANEVPATHVTMVVGMQMSFLINGLDALNETVQVAAGDVVTVTLSHRTGTEFDATVTLTLTEGTEDGDDEIVYDYEGSGTYDDPYIIPSLEEPVVLNVSDADLYFKYTAEKDGAVGIADITADVLVVLSDGSYNNEKVYNVVEGDELIFNVWGNGSATVGYDLVSAADGTEENPYIIEWAWDPAGSRAVAEVTVAAGETVYFNWGELWGEYVLTVNGEPVEVDENGNFCITNSGDTDETYHLEIAPPVGAYDNPEIIESLPFETTGSLEAEQTYSYLWMADEDMTLVLDVTEGANLIASVLTYIDGEEWPETEVFELASIIEDDNFNWIGWDVAENLVIELTAGQELKIEVAGLMDLEDYTYPAIEYTLTVKEHNEEAPEEEPSVAQVGETGYATLEAAMAAAAELGEPATVTLLAEIDAWDILVTPGITLDLNGFELRANYVAVFNGAHIIDSSADNTGKLCVGADSVIISTNNAQLPVWNGEAYVFSAVDFTRSKLDPNVAVTADQFGYAFQPQFAAAVKELLSNGAEDNGVSIEVRISWETGMGREYRNLVYNEGQIMVVIPAAKGAFKLTVAGLSAIEGLEEVVVEAVVRSATGVCCVSDGIVVTLP